MDGVKSNLKFEDGKLVYSVELDSDKDGKASMTNVTTIDAAEAIGEIAKTDLSWLEGIIKGLKV